MSSTGAWPRHLALSATLAVAACDPADDADDAGAGEDLPVYALMTQVYDADDRTVYIALTDTLDVDAIALDEAREFGGVANFAPIGGKLLVSDGESPTITEYTITDDLAWHEGRSVSFANYPLDDNANFYYQFIVDEETAYLPFEVTKRLVWNPAEMVIDGPVEDSNLTVTSGDLRLYGSGNRNAVRFDGSPMQSFFYVDDDWQDYGTTSQIAVYDPATDAEAQVIDAPCPGMAIATQDEAGNTYYGTWDYIGIKALYGVAPAPCMIRVKPDHTVDTAFTTDFTAATGGRYVNNFRYIGGGKAIGNVLHHEALDADFDGPFDQAVEDAAWSSGPHWKFWLFDVDAGTAHPVEGVDVAIGSGAQFAVLDGRTFVFLPYDDWARTKVYELDADGVATEHLDVTGDVFKWEKLR